MPASEIVKLTGPVPVFLNRKGWEDVCEPVNWLPKSKLAGVRLAPGTVPFTASAATCGDPVALSVTVRDPLTGPVLTGVAFTVTVQDAPAAKVEGLIGQSTFVLANGEAVVIVDIVTGPIPVFLIVSVASGLVAPTRTPPKFVLGGEIVND